MKYLILVVLVAVVWLWLPFMQRPQSQPTPHSQFADLQRRLAWECDLANPNADYRFAQSALPTERARRLIIADCVAIGPVLLPDVKMAIGAATDPELRAMWDIIAVALGDDSLMKKAAQHMIYADSPAVRYSAAQVLRQRRDERSVEWFQMALRDEHGYAGCGTTERYYPIRTVAENALSELGVVGL
jgi:hypothetical protein